MTIGSTEFESTKLKSNKSITDFNNMYQAIEVEAEVIANDSCLNGEWNWWTVTDLARMKQSPGCTLVAHLPISKSPAKLFCKLLKKRPCSSNSNYPQRESDTLSNVRKTLHSNCCHPTSVHDQFERLQYVHIYPEKLAMIQERPSFHTKSSVRRITPFGIVITFPELHWSNIWGGEERGTLKYAYFWSKTNYMSLLLTYPKMDSMEHW